MRFKEWLPITRRNRLALGLAAIALVMLVTWNCMPWYEKPSFKEPVWVRTGIAGLKIWPEVFSLENYSVITGKVTLFGFLYLICCASLILNAISVILSFLFWKVISGASFVRIPLAVANAIGAVGIVCFWFGGLGFNSGPFRIQTAGLIALEMLLISSALFVFKNELALRSERKTSLMCGR